MPATWPWLACVTRWASNDRLNTMACNNEAITSWCAQSVLAPAPIRRHKSSSMVGVRGGNWLTSAGLNHVHNISVSQARPRH